MNVNGDWDERFNNWKKEKNRNTQKKEKINAVEKEIVKYSDKVSSDVKKSEVKDYSHIIEPDHIKTIKIVSLLIPLIIIGYLIYSNFIASQEFDYFYDIGSVDEKYLSPITRISESAGEDKNYRNLTSGLVYFDVPVAHGSESVKIEVKFKDYFPEGARSYMGLGAKDQEVWHYNYHSIYSPSLNKLSEFPIKDNVYLINPNLYVLNPEELKYERNIVVAADKPYTPLPNVISDYKSAETKIITSLRGAHTSYIYIDGDLNLEVKKQDINWYEGSDELEIALYDSNNKLIANTSIEDDGITEVKNKETAKIQKGVFKVENLSEGVYKLELGEADALIREIIINTNKIVFQRVFLADNSLYGLETKPSEVYIKTNKNESLEMATYHREGIQNITYIEKGKNKTFNFYQKNSQLNLNLSAGEYELRIPKNDIILSGTPYFAFSKENYFEPFKQKVIQVKNDIAWLKENVDYIITDYKQPSQEEDWLIAETKFNIKDERLFIKNNKLSIVFNVPHLSQEDFRNYTIPVDWIKIKVYKPGVFAK